MMKFVFGNAKQIKINWWTNLKTTAKFYQIDKQTKNDE